MLPLIVIGADERTRRAFEQCPPPNPPPRFYEITEYAVFALNDELRDAPALQSGLVEWDKARNAWRANVAYGPRVLGLAATGQDIKLPHTGWTMVLAWDLGDPSASRRVVDGQPQGQDQSTLVWQVGPMLGANFVIDLAVPANDGTPFPGLIAVLNTMRERVEP